MVKGMCKRKGGEGQEARRNENVKPTIAVLSAFVKIFIDA